MGIASLGSMTFRIDPTSVAWPLKVKSAYFDTIGGRVVQVYGAELGDMTVSGEFGVGGWQEQEQFLATMKQVVDDQVNGAPIRFLYPTKNWDFAVYLTGYSGDGGQAVTHSYGLINPKWTLTLAIVDDNLDLKKVAVDAYLQRLAKGLGWKINEFNGPASLEAVQAIIQAAGAANIVDYLKLQFDGGSAPTAMTPDGSSGSVPNNGTTTLGTGAVVGASKTGPGTTVYNPPPGKSWTRGPQTADQMADLVVTAGITNPARAALFVAISKRESAWNSFASNQVGLDNSWGLWQINVINGAGNPTYLAKWRAADLTDPWTNAMAMMELSQGGNTFQHSWTTNPDGSAANGNPTYDVRKYLPEAIAAVNRRLSR